METGRRWQHGDDHNDGRMTRPYLLQSSKPCLNLLLDLALSPQNDAHRATILALPPQIEADTLPGDVADTIRSLLPSRRLSAVPPNSSSMTRPSITSVHNKLNVSHSFTL